MPQFDEAELQEEADESVSASVPPLVVKEAMSDEDQAAVQITGLSEEKIEEIITRVVERVVERVTRETMAGVAEKVITEAIEALKEGLKVDSE